MSMVNSNRQGFVERSITAAMLLLTLVAAVVPPLAAQSERLEQAADVARALDNPDARAATLAQVARHGADAGFAKAAGALFDEAADVADGIEDAEDRFWARLQIALAQRQAGLDQAFEATIQAAGTEATTTMPPPDRARLFSVGVQDFFEAGLIDAAMELNRGVRDPYRRNQNFTGIARGSLKNGDHDTALAAASGIDEARPREMLLTRVMNLAIIDNRIDLAVKASEAMPEGEAGARAARVVAIVRAVGDGNVDARLPGLLAGAEPSARSELLADLAVAHARAGAVEAADSALDRAVALADELAEPEMRARALEALAPAAAVSGQPDVALAVIKRLPEQSFERNGAIRLAVAELVAEREFASARRLAELFDHPPHRAQMYTRIAVAMTEAGKIEAALALLEGMDPARMRARALGDMVEAAAATGNVDAAARIADRIEDPLTATVARADLAAAQARAGDLEAARAVVQELDIDAYRESVLRHIAMAEADAGRFDAAAETAAQLTHDRHRPAALSHLARAQAAAGQVEAARITAATLKDGEARETALMDVAEALARSAAAG
jgi:hypothetical protein